MSSRGLRRVWMALSVLTALLLLAACGNGSPTATDTGTATPGGTSGETENETETEAPPERATVRAGIIEGAIAYAPFYIAQERGYFEDQNLDVELVGFRAGNDMIPVLASNDLQVGGVAPGPPLYNALERGIDFVIVGDTSSQAEGGQSGQALVVRADHVESGRYEGYEDLEGMTVALPTRYAANEFNLRKALELGGLTIDDVELVELGYSDMTTALATGAIDAALSSEPAVTLGVEEGIFVRVAGADEFYPDHQIGGLTYNAEFAATDAAQRFYLAYIQATRDYNDAFFKNEGREEMVELLIEVTSLKDPELYDKVSFTGLNPNGEVQVQSLRDNYEILREEGLVSIDVDFDELIDESFSEHAIEELGEYS